MSAAQFTPGPWVVEDKMSPNDLQRPWVQQAANPKYFTALACGDDTRNAYANARLIAAAPEMYALLDKTKAALLAEPFFATDPELAELFDDICAALAKARGAQ